MITLKTPLAEFPTVKKPILKKLHNLGLFKARDLLFYFPFRFDDFSQTVPIASIQPETRVTVRGQLQLIANRRSFYNRKFFTEAVLADNTGQLKVVWFNQPYLAKTLKPGDKLALAGKVKLDRFGLQMVNPVLEKEQTGKDLLHTGRLVPIYPITTGLTQKHLRFLINKALPLSEKIREWLPAELVKKYNFLKIQRALVEIHFPAQAKYFEEAKNRFKFEELFLLQLKNQALREQLKQSSAPALEFKETAIKVFVEQLPWPLTADQRRSAWEILQDIGRHYPMNRLLDGDVGSGKTVVAALAMYNTALNGFQSAIMAPTEILAMQHFHTLSKLFKNTKIIVGLLTSNTVKISNIKYSILDIDNPKKNKTIITKLINEGSIDVIIGTHALIQKKIKFRKLGLAIVDEQHRFGVEQRKKLKYKAENTPHFLSMTATPIPRSFALTLYGDLDLSIIKELPKGRQPILTKVVDEINRNKAYQFIRTQIKAGRQAFVVCPLIERNEEEGVFALDDRKAVKDEYKKLSEQIFPDLKIALLHGKMQSEEKETVMRDFLTKKFDLLVSTSVVEVGVDVPNATIMMIEGAERFGLAQLHQFRGRVGRGEHRSYCLLFYGIWNQKTSERLNYFANTADGFILAEKDLELRGHGDLYGTLQHGLPELKIADLKDLDLIKKSREAAKDLLAEDPALKKHPAIRLRLTDWEREVHLE